MDKAIPDVQAYGPVLYRLGRAVYAFSREPQRWDVLELPNWALPQRGENSIAGPTFEHGGHVYTFVIATGRWSDLDIPAILEPATGVSLPPPGPR